MVQIKVIFEDGLTPRINHKEKLFPKIAYSYFVRPSLYIYERGTKDFVPMNEVPPQDGKNVAGTLQNSFFTKKKGSNLFETRAVFGYDAFNPLKGEYYAEDQNETPYVHDHENRYFGYEGTDHYFEKGLNKSWDEMTEDLAKRYIKFLKSM